MNWYFCFNEASTLWFADMIKVAVISARAYTTLTPHCIYDGKPTSLTKWLQNWDVEIHETEVPFRSRLWATDIIIRNASSGYNPDAACGYYLPLQIAAVEKMEEYVLFTDCDVMFLKKIDLRSFKPFALMAAAEVLNLDNPSPKQVGKGFNSGVIIFNTGALQKRMGELLQNLEEHGYYQFPETGALYDQGLLNKVFQSEWELLPPEFNWRVFFGFNQGASIIHWHGPKPNNIADLLAGRPPNRDYTSALVEKLATTALPSYKAYYQIFQKLLQLQYKG